MEIVDFKNILEIPSLKNLEEDIRTEFGGEGLKKFLEHNIGLEIEVNSPPEFNWNKDEILKYPSDKNHKKGIIYNLDNNPSVEPIFGFQSKNVEVYARGRENYRQILIDFDLAPEKFLRIAFKI